MNKRILLTLSTALLVAMSQAGAQTSIYSEDFATDVTGGLATDIENGNGVPLSGTYIGGNNGQITYNAPVPLTSPGSVTYRGANNANNRSRALGLFVDTSSALTGAATYRVSFDVTDLTALTIAGNAINFDIYSGNIGNGAAGNSVTMDITSNSAATAPTFSSSGVGVVSSSLGGGGITTVQSYFFDFTLTGGEVGNAGDFLALAWTTTNPAGGASNEAPSLTLSNVDISTVVPEPSTYALLGGICALVFVMIRRRK